MLVRYGYASTRSFICPLSGDKENDEDNPQLFWDFRNYSEISYGYQVPYGKYGRPASLRAPDMPLAAHKGPFGAALEAGKPHPGTLPFIKIPSRPGRGLDFLKRLRY